ncbi:MAG: dynamin family protein, partial [Thermoguttaceae bacterium]|nr:dynamin family protein [Thermoguttaceae bacterium]MDW8039000.1 dynamin family protein [Thermoguttaceae bacterium]
MKRAEVVFSYEQFEGLIRRFCTQMPEYCLRHPAIGHLAKEFQRLRLLEALEQRFTVAIVGQMRVGKSTLLNALLGRDLAPTGITETTATINWFRYGQGEQCERFRVHWADGCTEDLPLDQASRWIGQEANAAKTKYLEFFADAEFLKTATVVDTPGTRSVLETHQQATEGFLAEKLEKETLRYGGRADAVLYVINPVGRESDRDLLQWFGQQTRLPGAFAYNSIAVVQKWEHLQPEPWQQVQQKCRRLQGQLAGKVAVVIPTSGLIARHVAQKPPGVWQQICDLASRTDAQLLETLLLSEQDFVDPWPAAPLDQSSRRAILSAVSWKILPICVRLAQHHRISDGVKLHELLKEVSGLPELRRQLERQFFSRARLIKTSTVLRKAWELAEMLLYTARQELQRQDGLQRKAKRVLELVVSALPRNVQLQEVRSYIEESLAVLERDYQTLAALEGEVDTFKYEAERAFELFNGDISSLELLETVWQDLPPEEAAELAALFGQAGPELLSRLRLDLDGQAGPIAQAGRASQPGAAGLRPLAPLPTSGGSLQPASRSGASGPGRDIALNRFPGAGLHPAIGSTASAPDPASCSTFEADYGVYPPSGSAGHAPGLPTPYDLQEAALQKARQRYRYWAEKALRGTGPVRQLAEHACQVLEHILNY